MVTSKRPFDGTSIWGRLRADSPRDPPLPSSVKPDASSALDRIMALRLAKDPAGRYANCDGLARDLYPPARRNAQVVGRPMMPLPRSAVWGAAALAVLAIAAVAFLPVVRAIKARLSVPPLPPSVAISLAPKARKLSWALARNFKPSTPSRFLHTSVSASRFNILAICLPRSRHVHILLGRNWLRRTCN